MFQKPLSRVWETSSLWYITQLTKHRKYIFITAHYLVSSIHIGNLGIGVLPIYISFVLWGSALSSVDLKDNEERVAYLCKSEAEARWRKISQTLVESCQKTNLGNVFHAQLVQYRILLENNLWESQVLSSIRYWIMGITAVKQRPITECGGGSV